MSQSKPIQRIEIPSVKSPKEDESFDLWKFLSTKPSESEASSCPVRGSLGYAVEHPRRFILILCSLIVLGYIIHPIHIN